MSSPLKITKMHGIGNDYVYVNGFESQVEDAPRVAQMVSDRHFGIGGDGLVLIQPPTGDAHCRMEMYNADGSRGLMCGNAIRCIGKFVSDHGIANYDVINVETDSGLMVLHTTKNSAGKVESVRVDMGPPYTAQKDLPADITGNVEEPALLVPLEVDGLGTFEVSLVSMGNPHCVIRLGDHQPLPDNVDDLDLRTIGPLFEHHPAFPERINTEFITIKNRNEIDFRVWERGSGETLACGTGACAAVVASFLAGWTEREVLVHLRGGDLEIEFDEATGRVFMTGPAEEVFTAEVDADWFNLRK